jgi:hypothetical protein
VNCFEAHTSGDIWCHFLDEKAIQELWVEGGLFFVDAQKKFFENQPKTRTPSYASALCHPQGIVAVTDYSCTQPW